MLSVTIIALGRLKEKYLKDAVDEYKKRLSTAVKLNMIELSPAPLSQSPSEKEKENALSSEAEAIRAKIPKGAYTVALCIEGKMLSSEKLAELFESVPLSGKSEIVFIIGSSFGLSESIKREADLRLSMSPMTFPHQLARIMLLEQIYRSTQINSGGKYHK